MDGSDLAWGEGQRRVRAVAQDLRADVIEIVTAESRWLVDLTRQRFQRCARRADLERALAFGQWTPLRTIGIDGDVLAIEPRTGPAIRAQLSNP